MKTEHPSAIFLQVILMHTPSFAGLVAITPEGTEIEKLITKLGLSLKQQILNHIRTPLALIYL